MFEFKQTAINHITFTNKNFNSGQNLINNYRPVQILNNRTIFYADLKLDCDEVEWIGMNSDGLE